MTGHKDIIRKDWKQMWHKDIIRKDWKDGAQHLAVGKSEPFYKLHYTLRESFRVLERYRLARSKVMPYAQLAKLLEQASRDHTFGRRQRMDDNAARMELIDSCVRSKSAPMTSVQQRLHSVVVCPRYLRSGFCHEGKGKNYAIEAGSRCIGGYHPHADEIRCVHKCCTWLPDFPLFVAACVLVNNIKRTQYCLYEQRFMVCGCGGMQGCPVEKHMHVNTNRTFSLAKNPWSQRDFEIWCAKFRHPLGWLLLKLDWQC